MPSVTLELGDYVSARPRKDGTFRVLFEVPPRLRPSGWSATIPLPVKTERPDGTWLERRGDLSDTLEVAAIQQDAAALKIRLIQARTGAEAPVAAPKRNFAALNRSWQATQAFKSKKPRTQQGYAYHAGLVRDWAEAAGDKPVAGLSPDAIEQFLALYDDRPTTRRHVKIVLKMLLDQAVKLAWRPDNPAAGIKVGAPETSLLIWTREDVLAGAWACAMSGQPGVAAMILTEWEIGQRITDVRRFRWGADYQPQDRAFRFWQSKTKSYITVPVSEALGDLLEAIHDPESLYLFVDAATGKPFAEQRLGHVWSAIREACGFDKRLQIRTLRHSCVVQLALFGVDIPGICSITGHALKSAHQILEKYLPKDNRLAWAAQKARGLIAADAEPGSMTGHNSRNAG